MTSIKWPRIELPSRIEVSSEALSPTFGRFKIEPFEKGMGIVIGNALRRVLLSSLEGTAVSSIRVKAILHEFSSIPGVLEDVTDIILNLKQLRVRLHNDTPTILRIVRNAKGEVHGSDFVPDANAEIVNRDMLICTLTEDVDVEIDVEVKKGRGFVRAEENIREGQEIGTIPVDSNFSPVRRVKFAVNDLAGSKDEDYGHEGLTLEVATDGTIGPEMALVEAGKILRKHLTPFAQYVPPSEGSVIPPTGGISRAGSSTETDDLLDKSVSALALSSRALNSLSAEKIETIRDLVSLTEDQLLQIKNFGNTSLTEVTRKLNEMGLTLGMIMP